MNRTDECVGSSVRTVEREPAVAGSTPGSDGDTPALAVAAGSGHAASPEGRPWVLAGYGVVTVLALTWFGVDPTLGVVAGALNVVFAIFFVRHLAFAIAAARWAGNDLLAADIGLGDYTPTVAVLVGCKNEELVVDGMVSALLALDYPADRLTLVVVDDGSDDDTGPMLDAWAAAEPRLQVLHRAAGCRRREVRRAERRPAAGRRRDRARLRRRPRARPQRRCAGWSGTSATRRSARSWAGASSATARSRRWPRPSSSTTSPATWSTSTAARRCSSCRPTAAPTARCACRRCARWGAGTRRPSPRTPTSRCGSSWPASGCASTSRRSTTRKPSSPRAVLEAAVPVGPRPPAVPARLLAAA